MSRISKIYFFLFFALPFALAAQKQNITLSGQVMNARDKSPLAFVNIILKKKVDSSFVTGTVANEQGRFVLNAVPAGNYIVEYQTVGFEKLSKSILIGSLSTFLDLGVTELIATTNTLQEVVVNSSKQNDLNNAMDKKTYSLANNISQTGGSVLQALKNLPGITSGQDGKVALRGSDKVAILIDGRQTALTGFNSQSGLENLPASAIEKIEIINNPSAKFDANGAAGIINIIFKKYKQEGFNGKVGLTTGLGALWQKKENLPEIRPQYQRTPKINPSLSLNYRKKKINAFFQGDWLYTETLNKNEFVTRTYQDGTVINQQTKRNRNTHFLTSKAGLDWNISENDQFSVSALYGTEKIMDRGDEPFFNKDLSKRLRLWQFLEDELKTTIMASVNYVHKFSQPGHQLNIGYNYTFHREDEKYFFENKMPTYIGLDSFKLLSDEHVSDFNLDYTKPLSYGHIEAGVKFRYRNIPTNMTFKPGINSPLDTGAGGQATYSEVIPAAYTNYVFENEKIEAEAGVRVEYVNLKYKVNPNHNTYKSDGYNYTEPFPNIRLAYKFNEQSKISLFYTRRVDRPNEVDIRIFPKYDDAEIIKVGNPGLKPQFTNSIELGYKTSYNKGFFYAAAYRKNTKATITRIATQVPPSTLIYNVFQNAGNSSNTGVEFIWQNSFSNVFSLNANLNIYQNIIEAFSVVNKYPVPSLYTAAQDKLTSGNFKLNGTFKLSPNSELQVASIYLAPDLIPQGKVGSRYSLDIGFKKELRDKKTELLINATDLLNTMRVKREIKGTGFTLVSYDYFETQVFRVGLTHKF